MLREVTAAAAVAALLAAPAALRAQEASPGVGVQLDVGASVLTGDDFEAAGTGFISTVLGSYAWSGGWEAGVAAGFADHDGGTQLSNVSAVARRRFYAPAAATPHVHPYLEGRLGWARLDPDGADARNGVEAGVGGGAEWWLSEVLGLVGGVTLTYLSVDEASGLHFVPRAGVKIRFGGS